MQQTVLCRQSLTLVDHQCNTSPKLKPFSQAWWHIAGHLLCLRRKCFYLSKPANGHLVLSIYYMFLKCAHVYPQTAAAYLNYYVQSWNAQRNPFIGSSVASGRLSDLRQNHPDIFNSSSINLYIVTLCIMTLFLHKLIILSTEIYCI